MSESPRTAPSAPPARPRVALVTGAARRIGRSLALDLSAHGWHVGVHYRGSTEDAEAVVGEIRNRGGHAVALRADLASLDEVTALMPRCIEVLGPPSCLVNNASEFLSDTAEDFSAASWATHLDINLRAPVFLAQALYQTLPDTENGNVINIIDQRVWRPTPDFFSYTISKAGLWMATRTLAQALAPRVRVNAIGPGPVLQSVHQTLEEFAAECAATPLGRQTHPEEIADAVRYILSAHAMTGQMIALDGGQHLDWNRAAKKPLNLRGESS